MKKNLNDMSMIEIAEIQMLKKRTPQKFETIAKEVCEILGMSNEEMGKVIGRFYSDLTLNGKFIPVGEGKWDLKNRQLFEVGDSVTNLQETSDHDDDIFLDDDDEDDDTDDLNEFVDSNNE